MIRKLILCAPFVLLSIVNSAFAQKVTLDYFFNHEVHTVKGVTIRYHYLWTDKANTGFSIWGDIFKSKGATVDTLGDAPTVQNLKGSAIYIIVDPDTKKENPSPNFINEEDSKQIAQWVRAGGILVLMANDSANVELPHFNILTAHFGMHFNDDLQNHVIDDKHFDDGAVIINNDPIFKTANKIFLKDVCSISLTGNAKPALRAANGAVIAAIARYGKGMVFAVGDPWFYNEYVNGRLPAGYENNKAANDLSTWLLSQATAKKH
jgi:hypothetical protein